MGRISYKCDVNDDNSFIITYSSRLFLTILSNLLLLLAKSIIMKSILFSFLFCFLLHVNSFCQSHFIRIDKDSISCSDSGEKIFSIVGWDVYQTVDSTATGEKTNTCLEFDKLTNGLILTEANLDAPIFLRNSADLDLKVRSSSSYSINMSVISDDIGFCDCNFECVFSPCSSIKLYFTTVFEGDTIKYSRVISDPIAQFGNLEFQNCFSTTKSDGDTKLNYIELTVAKEEFSEDDNIRFSNIYLQEDDFSSFTNRVVTNDFKNGAAYFTTPEYFTNYFFGNAYAVHRGVGFPSSDNKFFYNITPEDSTSKQIINLVLTPNNNLLLQDYTYLQGALVASQGNDSIRHTFNLINDGSTLCLPEFIEVASSGDGSLVYKSGFFDFQSYTSCLLFKENASLVVDRGATLDYGIHGKGLLALSDEAFIELKPHSTLEFNGEMILKKSGINNISISLDPSTHLIFGEGSRITSMSDASEIKLKIYMKGGVLDTSNLKESSLAYIEIIEGVIPPEQSFDIFPNPTSDLLSLTNTLNINAKYFMYNSNGLLIEKVEVESQNEKSIDVSALNSGVYFIKSDSGLTRKFVKI